MTDKLIISRKEIEALLTQLNITHQDIRALLDKAEMGDGEPVAQVAQEGFGRGQVYWHKKCPPDGTDLYTTQQPSRISELEAEIARLKAIIEDMKVIDNVFTKAK